jgi:hypothetical protein
MVDKSFMKGEIRFNISFHKVLQKEAADLLDDTKKGFRVVCLILRF